MLSKLKEIVGIFEDINITFNSGKEVEFFDPTNPQVKIVGEEKGDYINFFELSQEEIEGFEDNQLITNCQFIASIEKKEPLKLLATSII